LNEFWYSIRMNLDYRLYVLMRNDLQSMTPGRCMAQANHAASVFEHDWGTKPISGISEWKKQTKQGFGTCIVLAADETEIHTIFTTGLRRFPYKGWVIDPDYHIRVTHEVARLMGTVGSIAFLPETADKNTIAFTRSEKTCAYVFGTASSLAPYLGHLPLC
jgi:hypothetical protein